MSSIMSPTRPVVLLVLLSLALCGPVVLANISISLSASADIPEAELGLVCVAVIEYAASIANVFKPNAATDGEVDIGPWKYRNPELHLLPGATCTLGEASDAQAVISTTVPLQLVGDEAVFGLSTEYKGEQQMGTATLAMTCTLSSAGEQPVDQLSLNHQCAVDLEQFGQDVVTVPILKEVVTDKLRKKAEDAITKINDNTPSTSAVGAQLSQLVQSYTALQPIVQHARVAVTVQTKEAGGQKTLHLEITGKSDVPPQAVVEPVKEKVKDTIEKKEL